MVPRKAGVSADLVHACLLLQTCSQRHNLKPPYNESAKCTPMSATYDMLPNAIYAYFETAINAM
jgi:hypothetical protein